MALLWRRIATPEAGKVALISGMREAARAQAGDHHQSDEKGEPVDFFTHLHEASRLNPSFVQLSMNEGYSPAPAIIEPTMRWYEDADGSFIE